MCFWLNPSFPIVHITCFCNVMLPSSNHQINQHSSSQIKTTQKMIASLFLAMTMTMMMMMRRNFCVAPLKCEKEISDGKTFLCMPQYNFVDCSLTSQMVTYCLRLNIPLVFALNSSRFIFRSPRYFFIISLLLFCTQLSSARVNEHEGMADKRYTRHIKCALENSMPTAYDQDFFFRSWWNL